MVIKLKLRNNPIIVVGIVTLVFIPAAWNERLFEVSLRSILEISFIIFLLLYISRYILRRILSHPRFEITDSMLIYSDIMNRGTMKLNDVKVLHPSSFGLKFTLISDGNNKIYIPEFEHHLIDLIELEAEINKARRGIS
ncbi:MAG: hypothetical protein ACOC2K_03540 [Bacteroidota bacterium]